MWKGYTYSRWTAMWKRPKKTNEKQKARKNTAKDEGMLQRTHSELHQVHCKCYFPQPVCWEHPYPHLITNTHTPQHLLSQKSERIRIKNCQ